MNRYILFLLFLILILTPNVVSAESPIQLSIFNPLQLVNEDESIRGVRLNFIYGVNMDMIGIDASIATHTKRDLKGFQWGVYNYVGNDANAWQLGALNIVQGNYTGFQFGLVNFVHGDFEGVQQGLINYSNVMHGLQLGIINNTKHLNDGVQIGLINYNENKDPFGFLPFFNWSF